MHGQQNIKIILCISVRVVYYRINHLNAEVKSHLPFAGIIRSSPNSPR